MKFPPVLVLLVGAGGGLGAGGGFGVGGGLGAGDVILKSLPYPGSGFGNG